jgi:hypothetical protein
LLLKYRTATQRRAAIAFSPNEIAKPARTANLAAGETWD